MDLYLSWVATRGIVALKRLFVSKDKRYESHKHLWYLWCVSRSRILAKRYGFLIFSSFFVSEGVSQVASFCTQQLLQRKESRPKSQRQSHSDRIYRGKCIILFMGQFVENENVMRMGREHTAMLYAEELEGGDKHSTSSVNIRLEKAKWPFHTLVYSHPSQQSFFNVHTAVFLCSSNSWPNCMNCMCGNTILKQCKWIQALWIYKNSSCGMTGSNNLSND